MNIHEYQAKEILKRFEIPVPKGFLIHEAKELKAIWEGLGGKAVLKAQVHAGGRGKGGGIKIAKSLEEGEEIAKSLLGKNLITPQTDALGNPVTKLLVEELKELKAELYLAITIDRSQAVEGPTVISSLMGGMDIEEIARSSPESIVKEPIDPLIGFSPFRGRKIAYSLGLEESLVPQFIRIVHGLWHAFSSLDATLLEINPLAITCDNQFVALDCKILLDDDAFFRHPELRDLRDSDQENPLERKAKNYGVNYIKLDGSVGCMVNGAGLAMATMDLIKLVGGEPANFLDVGGGAKPDQIEKAFRILIEDKKVKAILVNIFGGILRCDRVAHGIIEAASNIKEGLLPMVIRLQGTNVEEGRKLLQNSGLPFEVAEDLLEATQKAVILARKS